MQKRSCAMRCWKRINQMLLQRKQQEILGVHLGREHFCEAVQYFFLRVSMRHWPIYGLYFYQLRSGAQIAVKCIHPRCSQKCASNMHTSGVVWPFVAGVQSQRCFGRCGNRSQRVCVWPLNAGFSSSIESRGVFLRNPPLNIFLASCFHEPCNAAGSLGF